MMRFRWILGMFLILGFAAPGLGESPTGASLVQLSDVTVEPREDGLAVQLLTSGQAKYQHELIDTPWRVVIDFEGTEYRWRKTPLTVTADPVRQIRGSQYRKGITRVVLELSRKTSYRVEEGPQGLTVKFEPTPVAKAKPEPGKIEPLKPTPAPKVATAQPPKPVAKPEPPKPPAPAVAKVEPPKPAAKPEPPKAEKQAPAKVEPPVKREAQPAKPAAKPEPGKIEPAKPPKPEAKPEPARAEPPKPPKPALAEVKPPEKAAPKAEPPKPVAKPEPPVAPPAEPVVAKAEPPAPTTTPPVKPVPAAPAPVRVAQAPGREAQAPSPANGKRLITFDFKDADIVNIFRILAAESGKNIVVGDDVKGKISLTLRNVTWDIAMEILLEARALQKIEKDNVIRIVSSEQLAKEREAKAKAEEAKLKADADIRSRIAEAQLKEQEVQQRKLAAELAKAEAEARGPIKEEFIRLGYRDPEEVVKTLIGILGALPEGPLTVTAAPPGAPPIAEPPFSALYGPGAQPPPARPGVPPPAELLAKGITIRADKPTNSIFIRHYEADLERIKKLIKEKLDIPLPQVKIQARMESIVRTALEEIGIQWGGAGAFSDQQQMIVGQGFATPRTGTGVTPVDRHGKLFTGRVNPNVPLTGFLPVSPTTGLPLGANVVNLPLTLGSPAGAIAFGIIGTRININLALQALETQGKTRNLARPEVVTVENAKATMSLGEEIPYATISSAGTQIQFKEASRRLEVTPTVVTEGDITRIKMKIIVEDNVRGATVDLGSAGSPPAIDKRKVETEVLIKEGETLVVGGVGVRRSVETLTRVPLFGQIPVLGWLFKKKAFDDRDEELAVFITPTVIKPDQPKPAQSVIDKPKKGS